MGEVPLYCLPQGPTHYPRMAASQQLYRNVQRFRGGLVCKAHRLVHHSTLGLRVIKQKKRVPDKTRGVERGFESATNRIAGIKEGNSEFGQTNLRMTK